MTGPSTGTTPTTAACPCEAAQDPRVVTNPPGLPSIANRVDDFTGFRRALLRPLAGEQALGAWRPAAGDLGLQFLEWWAYIADVLTFYNERVANETYLRTAEFPESIAGMVGLLGYMPAPGLAATGQVGAIRTTTRPAEPLVIPPAMQLSSTATPGVPAQTFEAVAATFPGLSDVVATLPPDPALQVRSDGSSTDAGPASVLLAGKVTAVKLGDALLLVAKGWSGTDDNWSAVTVAAVSPETDPGTGAVNTRVAFSDAAVWGVAPVSTPSTQSAGTGYGLHLIEKAIAAISFSGSALALAGEWQTRFGVQGGWFRGASPPPPAARAATDYRLMKAKAATSLWNQQGADISATHNDAGSGDYVLPTSGSGQSGWRWCKKCQSLFFAGNSTQGVCPAGGPHDHTGSGHYVVPDSGTGQSGWRWCNKCQVLFFLADTDADSAGVCPAGGPHNHVGSGSYVLPHSGAGQSDWRWCNRCQSLFFAGNPTQDVCPAGGAVLSATVRSIQPGDLVYFDSGAKPGLLGLVTGTRDRLDAVPFPQPLTPPAPDIIVPRTALTLATAGPDTLTAPVESIAVRYSFRDVATVLPNPKATLPALPATVAVPAGFTLGRGVATALLEDATGAGTLVAVAPAGPSLLTLSPTPTTTAAFDPALQVPLRLLFDVVTVSRGTTVRNEVLGSGNAAVANQRFGLKKSPLTYLASGAGWSAALAVYVDGIKWSEVPTLYNQPADARVYVVERATDQTATIRFGDGANGSRLTSGSGNVVATYRYGSGAASPPAGRLTTIVHRQPNLAAIRNPAAVAPGKDPQAPEDVKTDGPASVFTFGRAISALDYEVVAAQAAGVTRAKAYWTFDAGQQRSLVKIYVNDDTDGVLTATQALAGADDPNRPVTVAAAQAIEVSVSATLVVAADWVIDDVVAAATAAFADPTTGAFSPTSMGIGQRLYRSRLVAALSVPGVVAVHQLEVTWTMTAPGWFIRYFPQHLDEMADPGEGAYFELAGDNLALLGASANG